MSIISGSTLGKFVLEDQLGGGGMGSVYKARDKSLGRTVAIKILDSRFEYDLENIERFEREARTLASLKHPNLMHVYDVGTEGLNHYFAMEYIEGSSLNELIDDQTHPIEHEESLRIIIEIMAGLSKVHHSGIIHRDIKPANIMIENTDGRAVLVDFGLSKSAKDSGLTSAGSILGTPDYISPEQIEGFEAGYYSDIYSLGVVFYEMLFGENPFSRESAMQTIRAHCSYTPPSIRSVVPKVSKELSRIIDKMIAVDPSGRYQNIVNLALDLRKVCEHPLLDQLVRAKPSSSSLPKFNDFIDSDNSFQSKAPYYESKVPTLHSTFSFWRYFTVGFGVLILLIVMINFSSEYPENTLEASVVEDLNKSDLPITTYTPSDATSAPTGIQNPSIIMYLHNGERVWGRVLSGESTDSITVGLFPNGTGVYSIDDIEAIIIADSEALVDKIPNANDLVRAIYSDNSPTPNTNK